LKIYKLFEQQNNNHRQSFCSLADLLSEVSSEPSDQSPDRVEVPTAPGEIRTCLVLIHDNIHVTDKNETSPLNLAGNMNGTTSQPDLEGYVRQIVNFPDSSTTGSADGVDAILAPIFKDILQNDAGREFTGLLDAFTVEKVGEIEKMCNSNHQEFVGAVEKLLKARKGAAGLKVQSISPHPQSGS
jgi:hypothetical protein